MKYPLKDSVHPDDGSIKTFTGHVVQRTLIRCYFRDDYCYTGSADGIVHIFNMNDDSVTKINTQGLVRDLCWHEFDPKMVIAPWSNNYHEGYLNIYEPF